MKDHAVHENKGRLNHCSFLAEMEHVKLCHNVFLVVFMLYREDLQASKTVKLDGLQKKCI